MKTIQKDLILIEQGKDSFLQLPAQSTLENVFQHPRSPDLLREVLQPIAWQRRVEYTVERAILSPNLAPSWVAALLAWGALAAYPNERKTSPLEEYLRRTGYHSAKISAILVPVDVPGRVWELQGVARTPSDSPIVLAVAVLDVQESIVQNARLALTGTWPENARLAQAADLMLGKPLSKELIQQIAEEVEQEVNPPENFLGGKPYRKAMAGVLTRRALQACAT